jgi:head-tail adaptor
MSLGKMRSFIQIVETVAHMDAEGYAAQADQIVASARAYMEPRHGNEKWANRAAFSEASCLFRFRVVPGVPVTTAHAILCDGARYRILSVEDVRKRGMYVECLADRVEPTMR